MEKKEPVKISLPLFITIIVLLVACISGIYIFMQNQKLDKEIAGLKEQISKTQAEKNELQEKLNKISDVANDTNTDSSTESNIASNSSNNSSVSFTDEQVKTALVDYLDLEQSISDIILIKLTEKGLLNYNRKDNTINNNEVNYNITKIKFEDYKKAMLNFISENEFQRLTDKFCLGVNNNGYLTFGDAGGGTVATYTITNIEKINDTTYTAKTSYTVDVEEPPLKHNKDFTVNIKQYNGKCVIDSVK